MSTSDDEGQQAAKRAQFYGQTCWVIIQCQTLIRDDVIDKPVHVMGVRNYTLLVNPKDKHYMCVCWIEIHNSYYVVA